MHQMPSGKNSKGWFPYVAHVLDPLNQKGLVQILDEMDTNFDFGRDIDINLGSVLHQMKLDGLVEAPARGRYIITAYGLSRFPHTPNSNSHGISMSPLPKHNLDDITRWEVLDDVDPYAAIDSTLRETLLKQSSCFGSYIPTDNECIGCNAKARCQNLLLSRLPELTRSAAREEEEELEAWRKAEKRRLDNEERLRMLQNMVGDSQVNRVFQADRAPFAGFCPVCSKSIAVGSAVVHLPGIGMIHPGCAHVR
jgi:hypothetical protein